LLAFFLCVKHTLRDNILVRKLIHRILVAVGHDLLLILLVRNVVFQLSLRNQSLPAFLGQYLLLVELVDLRNVGEGLVHLL